MKKGRKILNYDIIYYLGIYAREIVLKKEPPGKSYF